MASEGEPASSSAQPVGAMLGGMASEGEEPLASFRAELAAWEDPAFEVVLRARLASVPGLCVLDVSADNILNFCQSDWGLVARDLAAAFSEGLAECLASSFREEVETCWAVRRELINYKKLCLHMWKAGATVEKDIRQLASFFFCELPANPPPERWALYSEVANTMNECRGAVSVIWDARCFGKAICNLPRHPASGVPRKLEELPGSLEVWKVLERAQHFVTHQHELDCYFEACAGDGAAPLPLERAGDGDEEERPRKPARVPKQQLAWESERLLVLSPLSTGALEQLLASVRDAVGLELPPLALLYVERVLVARGAAKALALRCSLRRYCRALRDAASRAEQVRAELRGLLDAPRVAAEVSAGLRLVCEKYWRMMQGMTAVLPEMLQWLEPMCDTRRDAARLFVSGARGAAAFVPPGFADLLQPYRLVARQHRATMLEELARGSWPKYARPRPEEEVNLLACKRCSSRYTRLWLHRELCFACEADLRSKGRCPFSERCGERSFCPHDRLCVVCEQWSCERCRLLRGDGEEVWQVVGHWRPAVLFLDFDRTLATTKSGASPLVGNHAVDPELAAVCAGHGNVHIVTRSSRKQDIEAFLAARDVPVKQVHSLALEGRRSKSEVILEELAKLPPADARGLFVDDDIRELTDPALDVLLEEGRLQRLLFVRAGGKE